MPARCDARTWLLWATESRTPTTSAVKSALTLRTSEPLHSPNAGLATPRRRRLRFWCLDCENRITRSAAGIEYGHERGIHAGVDRCERRPYPSVVDTQDDRRRAGFATDEIRDCEDNDLLPTSPLPKSEKESV